MSAVSIAGAPVFSKDFRKPCPPSVVVGGTLLEVSTGTSSNVIIVYGLSPSMITPEESKDVTPSEISKTAGGTCSGKGRYGDLKVSTQGAELLHCYF